MIKITPPQIADSDVITPTFAFTRYVPPEGTCTHCGTACDTLEARTVVGYGAVVNGNLCPRCIESLDAADDFVSI